MLRRALKLKQASAVLKVEPKELQNLVQFGVVKPKTVDGVNFFDRETLLTAKVAFRLKESLGTRASVLMKLIDVFRASQKGLRIKNPEYVIFTCRFSREEEPIKLGVPFRSLGDEIEQGLSRADLYPDMPRGRKRAGWKKEFLNALSEAAKDIGEISEEEIQRTIRSYREERRMPEITVAAEV
jgi:plasmid maintenance system antidote protein VapI